MSHPNSPLTWILSTMLQSLQTLVSDALRKVARGLWSVIPETSVKQKLRCLGLSLKSELPRGAYVNRGDCVVHVGVADPSTLRDTLRLVGPAGYVVGLEPECGNFARLMQDSVLRVARNVTLLKKAVWSRQERLLLT